MNGKNLLLLHQCCAICSMPAVEELSSKYDIMGYWHNPNIEPPEEHNLRREALLEFNRRLGIKTFFDEKSDIDDIGFYPSRLPRPERCTRCYEERLDKAARFASKNGCQYFSTTLFSSPYQQHELILQISRRAALKWKVSLVYFDGRKNYHAALCEIRNMGMYRQRYCGCLQSLAEREIENKSPANKSKKMTTALS